MASRVPADSPQKRRIRASKPALEMLLEAAEQRGMPVERVRIEGAAFVIDFGKGVDRKAQTKQDGGLKGWD